MGCQHADFKRPSPLFPAMAVIMVAMVMVVIVIMVMAMVIMAVIMPVVIVPVVIVVVIVMVVGEPYVAIALLRLQQLFHGYLLLRGLGLLDNVVDHLILEDRRP
jgi:hypothetical protein